MLKTLLLTVTALLFIACNIQKKGTNIPDEKRDVIASDTNSMIDEIENYKAHFGTDFAND
jgi:outer membrane biogenesis lipoprotein LolB